MKKKIIYNETGTEVEKKVVKMKKTRTVQEKCRDCPEMKSKIEKQDKLIKDIFARIKKN